MKRTICSLVLACAGIVGSFAETLTYTKGSLLFQLDNPHVVDHVDTAYAMRKHHDDGSIYVIRVKEEDNKWHDWYVCEDKAVNDQIRCGSIGPYAYQFIGYEDDGVVLVDNIIDIATE